MSHVSALPSDTAGVAEATADATEFALATLSAVPSLLQHVDVVDAVVGVVGLAALGRLALQTFTARRMFTCRRAFKET